MTSPLAGRTLRPLVAECGKVVFEVVRDDEKRKKMRRIADRYEKHGVILIDAFIRCSKCGAIKPVSDVGLRKLSTGEVRNQAQCRTCRAKKKEKK